ncbi:MAG: hypothetical protein WCG04_02440 [Alphaproteobacteria bacterium]
MKKHPRPTIFLGPTCNPQERKGTCDIAFIGGTFTVAPHMLSRLQQWLQRYSYWHKESWTSILKAYVIHYQPDPAAFAFLKQATNLPIRHLYFWPLEVAQQILKKHRAVTWSLLWLPTPPGPVSMIVYHNDRPLFCRTLLADATLAAEITQTQQYLKRFGYEKSMKLNVFAPKPVTIPDPSLAFIVYDPPIITRPVAPLSAPELARNHWLAFSPLAAKMTLAALLLFGSTWQLMDVYQQQLQLEIASPQKDIKDSGAIVAPSLASTLYVTAIICDDDGWAIWINGQKWTNTTAPQGPYTIKSVTPSQVTLMVEGEDVVLGVKP